MKTEDLIERLGRDLHPVKRLASPGRRASVWLAWGGLYIAVVFTQAWIRHGIVGTTAALPYVLEQVAVALVGVAAALAAFESVIPGRRASRATSLLMVSATVMMAALGWSALSDVNTAGTLGVGREADWPCVISITLGGGGLWALAIAMLRRGAPLAPIATSIMSGVAALSLANLEACISRPHAFTATVIVWHGLTAIVLLTAFAGIGRRLIRWTQATSTLAQKVPEVV